MPPRKHEPHKTSKLPGNMSMLLVKLPSLRPWLSLFFPLRDLNASLASNPLKIFHHYIVLLLRIISHYIKTNIHLHTNSLVPQPSKNSIGQYGIWCYCRNPVVTSTIPHPQLASQDHILVSLSHE